MNTRTIGTHAEQFVAQELEKEGFKVVEHSYRKRYGEIDLIALKDSLLVFVEVKMRNADYFNLGEVITKSKQKKIIMAAQAYLMAKKYDDKMCRFDIAFVHMYNNKPHLTYVPDAFIPE